METQHIQDEPRRSIADVQTHGMPDMRSAVPLSAGDFERHTTDFVAHYCDCKINEALESAISALQVAQAVFVGRDLRTAIAHKNVGDAYVLQGKISLAEPHFRESIEIRRALRGNLDPDIPGILNEIGDINSSAGDHEAALKTYQEALILLEGLPQAQLSAKGALHFKISEAFEECGNQRAAAEHMVLAYRAILESPAVELLPVALIVSRMANTKTRQGKLEEAALLYKDAITYTKRAQESLSTVIKVEGCETPLVRALTIQLSRMQSLRGEYPDAVQTLDELLRPASAAPQSGDSGVVQLNEELARIYGESGQHHKAERILRETLAKETNSHGEEKKEIVASLCLNLARVCMDSFQIKEAQGFAKRVRSLLGATPSEELVRWHDLQAGIWLMQGELEKAEKEVKAALEVVSRLPNGPQKELESAGTQLTVAYLHLVNERFDEAEQSVQESQETFEQYFPSGMGRGTVLALRLKGMIANARGDHATAEELFTNALELRDRVYGKGEAHLRVGLLNDLAGLYSAIGRAQEAKPLLTEARSILEGRSEEMHPELTRTLQGLGEIAEAAGDYEEAKALEAKIKSIFTQLDYQSDGMIFGKWFEKGL